MPKVLITDEISEEALDILKKAEIEYDYIPAISYEELKKLIKNYDAVVVRGRTKITKEILEHADALKIIARVGVGLDNIDVSTAKNKGIEIITAGAATANSVAELTIGLMINLTRPIIFGEESMRRGFWTKSMCIGRELYGKVLGIIGLGNIGSRVAQIAKAMGLKVIGYDVIREKVDEAGVDYYDFDNLLESSDIISLHVPLLSSTKGMISKREIEKMKNGVLIINTARMELIDLEALIWGLETGKIGGYAADSNLKPTNPYIKRLLGFPNVILTPHIGAQTIEAQKRAAEVVFSNLTRKLKEFILR